MKKILLIAMTFAGIQVFAQTKTFCSQESDASSSPKVESFISAGDWAQINFNKKYGMIIDAENQKEALKFLSNTSVTGPSYLKIGTIKTIKLYSQDENGYNIDQRKGSLDVYYNSKFYYFDFPKFENDGETSVPKKWYISKECIYDFLSKIKK